MSNNFNFHSPLVNHSNRNQMERQVQQLNPNLTPMDLLLYYISYFT